MSKPTWDTLWPRFKPACANISEHEWHVRCRNTSHEPIAVCCTDGYEFGYGELNASCEHNTAEGLAVLKAVRQVWSNWKEGR
jgi:hypothetical protein